MDIHIQRLTWRIWMKKFNKDFLQIIFQYHAYFLHIFFLLVARSSKKMFIYGSQPTSWSKNCRYHVVWIFAVICFPGMEFQHIYIKMFIELYFLWQRQLEQLECLCSEIPPAAPWLPILVIHIRSQVKTRQKSKLQIFKNCPKYKC